MNRIKGLIKAGLQKKFVVYKEDRQNQNSTETTKPKNGKKKDSEKLQEREFAFNKTLEEETK